MVLNNRGVKVYLGLGATDMRKSMDSLALLVSDQLGSDPLSGHLFVFCNRKRSILKILYWDRTGFCIWHKRLEKSRFRWPQSSSEVSQISPRELQWLLEGLDLVQPRAHEGVNYSRVY